MRLIVFFDLPIETAEERRNYRKFRKVLINNGFFMIQKSVYCRMLPSPTTEATAIDVIRRNKPPEGLVTALRVTEKQFARMEYIVGASRSDVVDTVDSLVIL